MSDHVHKFNATLIKGRGRCSCGAWARWDRDEKTWGSVVTHPGQIKGLETRLRRLKDPNHHYEYESEMAKAAIERSEQPRFSQYEAKTVPDAVDVIERKRRP